MIRAALEDHLTRTLFQTDAARSIINALEWRTTMSIVAEKYAVVIGVDTHACTHTYAIIDTATGARAGCEAFPVTAAGMKRAMAWIDRNTTGPVLVAMGGTASYGASLTRTMGRVNLTVVEAKPPRRQARAGVGKTDEIDAIAAAMGVLGKNLEQLLQPRSDGLRAAISILLASRQRVDQRRTASRNALNALVRTIDLGVDARKALTDQQVAEISSWHARITDSVEQQVAREEAIELAKSILTAEARLKQNKAQLADFSEQLAPGFQTQPGLVGAGDHRNDPHCLLTPLQIQVRSRVRVPRGRRAGPPAGFLGKHHQAPAQSPRGPATEQGLGHRRQKPYALR